MKGLVFVDSTLDDLREFPEKARREVGYELHRVQSGKEPHNWKPMKTVGPGVREIRINDQTGAFRVIYVANIGNAVYALHAFQKKTQKTNRTDIELAQRRFNQISQEVRRGKDD